MLLHSGHITACYSRHDSDIHLMQKRLELESDHVKTARIIHSAQRTCTHFVKFPTLAQTEFQKMMIHRLASDWMGLSRGNHLRAQRWLMASRKRRPLFQESLQNPHLSEEHLYMLVVSLGRPRYRESQKLCRRVYLLALDQNAPRALAWPK